MKLKWNLLKGVFLERLNRFTVMVKVDEKKHRVHLADPGRLKELLVPGTEVLISERKGLKRKTKYEALAFRKKGLWVVVNSRLHNKLAEELLRRGLISELKNYQVVRREYVFGGSRIDFLLKGPQGETCLLEVKGCTLVKDGVALFPDAPTERGRRHIDELVKALSLGMEAAVLFLVMRRDAEVFRVNRETDPWFADSLRRAHEKGVKIFSYSFSYQRGEIKPLRRISVNI